ncbi:cytochrome P450 4C1-like isoform X1 [Periplaneta americana]|uniref:cytochrome P450 4C1-like isoform X1 n=2 Tax=Periplaneta americana TaxID=6978 RepID=UPI0037E7667A
MEPTTLLLVAVLIVGMLLLRQRDPEKLRIKRMMDKLPGLPSYPILGSILPYIFVKPEDRWGLTYKIAVQYKPLIKWWIGPFPAITIVHPDFAEAVLNNTHTIEKTKLYKIMEPWLGSGLITSTGLKWHTHRKIITPSFHFKILENFVPIFSEKADILVKKLKEEVGGRVFDVYPYVSACTLDIICESAMGTCVNAQLTADSDYVKAVYNMKKITMERIAQPHLLSDFILSLTKWGKLQDKCLKVIHGFTIKVIKDRKEQREKTTQKQVTEDEILFGYKRRVALLDMLLEASENGVEITDEEIQQEVDTFMFAGHDTVSAAVSSSLYMLGLHPEIQDKVYEELKEIFQDSDRSPNMKDLQDMKYLQMVIKEALRILPSVPSIGRQTSRDMQLGPYTIPAGITVIVPAYILHLDPDIFPNPRKFNPDNFLPDRVVNRHPYAYIPFSAGPRNCVGQKFAMLEVKAVLSSILRHYEVRSVDKMEDLVLMFEIVLNSKYGFRISLTERKHKEDCKNNLS